MIGMCSTNLQSTTLRSTAVCGVPRSKPPRYSRLMVYSQFHTKKSIPYTKRRFVGGMMLRVRKTRDLFHSSCIRHDAVSYTLRTRAGCCEYTIRPKAQYSVFRKQTYKTDTRNGIMGTALHSSQNVFRLQNVQRFVPRSDLN
jgi:hypothetical protein